MSILGKDNKDTPFLLNARSIRLRCKDAKSSFAHVVKPVVCSGSQAVSGCSGWISIRLVLLQARLFALSGVFIKGEQRARQNYACG